MNNKELILKRLLEDKHITIEEMFILNETKMVIDEKIIIKEFSKPFDTTPIPLPWVTPSPYCHSTITCDTNLLTNTLPSDYKMD